jgi:hypothetical protein
VRHIILSILTCVAIPVFSQVNLQQGLVACYSFSGNANDGTGHNHNGSVNGAKLTTDRFGAANNAYQFNGYSDYIEIPAAPFKNPVYSYSLWARVSSLPASNGSANIFSIGDETTSKHQTINVSDSYASGAATGITVGGYNNGEPPTTSVQSGILPSVNTWYHIVSVRVNNEMRMYVNGVLIGTASANMTTPHYGSNVHAFFGARCNYTQFFNGAIDDIVLYDRALTVSEVQELYQHGTPCSALPVVNLQQGLVACYAFSGDATDGSGHGNDGTLHGPVLTSDRFSVANAAYSLDGVDDYISIPSQPLIANKVYTFSMWINVITNPSYGGSATLISIGQSSGKHLGVTLTNHYATADFLGWTSGGSNETGADPPIVAAESKALPNANRWYHVVTTRDKDFLTLYVNGVYVASDATHGTRPLYFDPATYTATLGIRAGLIQPLNAILDDVAIYDRAINAAEVDELYRVGLPCPGPMAESVFIPNVITPDNNDDLNDIFTLYIVAGTTHTSYTGKKPFSMIIENRWGTEVFSTSDVIGGWRGQNVASGIYYYLIKFGEERYKGWVRVVK